MVVLMCAAVLCGACQGPLSAPPPAIEFSVIPPAAGGGPDTLLPIAGRVVNGQRGDVIVLFAKSNLWWVQPFRSRPFTAIAQDWSWKTTTHLGTEVRRIAGSSGVQAADDR